MAGSLGLRGRKARAVVAVGEGGELGVVRGHAQQLRQRHGAEQVVEGLLGAVLLRGRVRGRARTRGRGRGRGRARTRTLAPDPTLAPTRTPYPYS